MRTTTLLLTALIVTGFALALAPAAEARQACTYGTGEPCDDQLACVYDRVSGQWRCVVYIDPCNFRCWGP